MNRFIFQDYEFNKENLTAYFRYSFEDGRKFEEIVTFSANDSYNEAALDRALHLAFILIGTSYYKTFPSVEVELSRSLDEWQAEFFNSVYQEGLSQFAFENQLHREELARFISSDSEIKTENLDYSGEGLLVLQSGGKDSLLSATMLKERQTEFTGWYVSSSDRHPKILDDVTSKLEVSMRTIDLSGLKLAIEEGGLNGHVPITYIVQSLAVIQAILLGKSDIIVSIAHEGEEPHDYIGDLAVTHQWSKTWKAEEQFARYITNYVANGIRVGSPLRNLSELRVAELFVQYAWQKYGHEFSSCNVANYTQGADNSDLKWCGNCPKCANSYLLFAPFVNSDDLKSLFAGQDLFSKSTLAHTFKGLLGIDDVPKPFECIGEIDELRLAYHKAQERGEYGQLPFEVPTSSFDYLKEYPAQDWAVKMLQ